MDPQYWAECERCEHYGSEHKRGGGECLCIVVDGSSWRCPCVGFEYGSGSGE